MNKIRVGVLFGGKSEEHEISLQSAKNIVAALDPERYEIVLIGISKKGTWHSLSNEKFQALFPSSKNKTLPSISSPVESIPMSTFDIGSEKIDVIFPVLHGTYGEDGTIQGLLEVLDIPYVGAGVLGSAIGMDKDVAKRLLRDAGLPTAKFEVFTLSQKDSIMFEELESSLGLPFFIKPANSGSSIGVSKVSHKKQFGQALSDAFRIDKKILIEEYIPGRELECSVLGNYFLVASAVGEIIVKSDFYSYEAKYIDSKSTELSIPAKISEELEKKIQDLSIQACEVLSIQGMARVDFFLSRSNVLYINEINTIPGFTNSSMYPKLWEESGLSQEELVERLIELALERNAEKVHIK